MKPAHDFWVGLRPRLREKLLAGAPATSQLVVSAMTPAFAYFVYQLNAPRGDEHHEWGTSDWYFELEADLHVRRQMEIYDNGIALSYDLQHKEDQFGRMLEWPLNDRDFAPVAIARAEFEQLWNSRRPFNR